jgi:branched-chain amino acid transport system ATP-binding protein
MPSALLKVDNLIAGYGKADVLRSLSLHVDAGERVGLFGPNGHGKTTLLRTISGLMQARSGAITFLDDNIGRLSPRQIVERGLIHVPQGNTMFPRMTILENLYLGAYSNRSAGQRDANLDRVFTLFPRLKERTRQLARTLSGGERQMLSIGVGLMGAPILLILDEPSLGLAPKIKDELTLAIGEIARSGVTMIIVDQDIEMLLGLCQRMYLIEQGNVSLETNDMTQVNQKDILEMYFGKASGPEHPSKP